MTVLLEDGPGGLENTHLYTPSGGSALTMNLLQSGDTVLLPRIKFDDMPGFRSLPDADDNRMARTARIGETTYPSLVRGRTFNVNGRMQARDLEELRELQRSMFTAFGERSTEGTWASVPLDDWANGAEAEAGHWAASVRVIQFESSSTFGGINSLPTPYQHEFEIGVRMSDPRWYWTVGESSSHASSVTVSNRGNAPTDPVVTVTSPSGDVTITNTTTGKSLVFQDISGAPGPLVVNFAARTAVFDAVTDVDALSYLDVYQSDWWDLGTAGLRAGSNTVTQSGGSLITVAYQHAAW